MQILVFGPILLHGLTREVPILFNPYFKIEFSKIILIVICIEKGQKEHTKCYMISNPTPKFTSQIRSIRSVFGRNRTGTGSEKIDRIDRNRNRNRISGRTLVLWNVTMKPPAVMAATVDIVGHSAMVSFSWTL